MRYALLFALAALLPAGCSQWIARQGEWPSVADREQAHLKYGEPVRSGTTDGRFYEEFRTRKKFVRDPGWGYDIVFIMTGGLIEVVALPLELGSNAWRLVVGRRFVVVYNEDSTVYHEPPKKERLRPSDSAIPGYEDGAVPDTSHVVLPPVEPVPAK